LNSGTVGSHYLSQHNFDSSSVSFFLFGGSNPLLDCNRASLDLSGPQKRDLDLCIGKLFSMYISLLIAVQKQLPYVLSRKIKTGKGEKSEKHSTTLSYLLF